MGGYAVKKKANPVGTFTAKLLVCILMLIFVFIPFPASGLTIRLYFGDFEGENILVYYTTDENPDMGNRQTCTGTIDTANKLAVIKLSPELADHITQIRFDFPETEQLLSIKNVSVSSAGIIQHQYDPCDFFSENNILAKNDIPEIDLIKTHKTAYIKTNQHDPYLLFDSRLLRDMLQYRSSYRLTRIIACLLILAGYALYRIRPFSAETGNKISETVRP